MYPNANTGGQQPHDRYFQYTQQNNQHTQSPQPVVYQNHQQVYVAGSGTPMASAPGYYQQPQKHQANAAGQWQIRPTDSTTTTTTTTTTTSKNIQQAQQYAQIQQPPQQQFIANYTNVAQTLPPPPSPQQIVVQSTTNHAQLMPSSPLPMPTLLPPPVQQNAMQSTENYSQLMHHTSPPIPAPLPPPVQQTTIKTTVNYTQLLQTAPPPEPAPQVGQQSTTKTTVDYSNLMTAAPPTLPPQQQAMAQSTMQFSQLMQSAPPALLHAVTQLPAQSQHTTTSTKVVKQSMRAQQPLPSNTSTSTRTTQKVHGSTARQTAAGKGTDELKRFDTMIQEWLGHYSATCPKGYWWDATKEGYLCRGFSHLVTHDEVEKMLKGERPEGPHIERVNNSFTRSVTPDYTGDPDKDFLDEEYRKLRWAIEQAKEIYGSFGIGDGNDNAGMGRGRRR